MKATVKKEIRNTSTVTFTKNDLFSPPRTPQFATHLPVKEWNTEYDPGRMVQMLKDSAKAVREAVKEQRCPGCVQKINSRYSSKIGRVLGDGFDSD